MNNRTTEELETLTFEENILLAGVVAKIYSEADYHSPIQGWARAVPNRELMVGDTLYRCAHGRLRIDGQEQSGVQMTVVRPDKSMEHYFMPIDHLRTLKIELKGFRI